MLLKIRGMDRHGSGHFGAKRGVRKHNGSDLINHTGEAITSFCDGTVTKIGFPYDPRDCKKGGFRYVEVSDAGGRRFRYFYSSPLVDIGQVIQKDEIIGAAQELECIYPGITQHCHFEIKLEDGKFIDPVKALQELGYAFEGQLE